MADTYIKELFRKKKRPASLLKVISIWKLEPSRTFALELYNHMSESYDENQGSLSGDWFFDKRYKSF